MTARDFVDMKLHEAYEIDGINTVLRVAGGFIYFNYKGGSVFVPLDMEFVNKKSDEKINSLNGDRF